MTDIITPRLHLRRATVDDLERLYALTESPTMRRYLGADPPSRSFSFNRMLQTIGSWTLYGYGSHLIFDRVSGAVIGTGGVFHSYRGLGDDFDNMAEAGWIIAEEAWGKGYAVEAMTAVLDWFDAAHGHPVVAMIETGNAASERVAAKLGFAPMRTAMLHGASMRLYRRA